MNLTRAAALLSSLALVAVPTLLHTESKDGQSSTRTDSSSETSSNEPGVIGERDEQSVRSLARLLDASELAFFGEVVRIEHANSLGDSMHPNGLPHTFVTFRVDSTLRGASTPFVTLRFLGGPDHSKGLVLRASHVPVFEVGSTDILFVRGNGQSMSPLVDPILGRLSVRDGRVLTASGRPIRLDAQSLIELVRPASEVRSRGAAERLEAPGLERSQASVEESIALEAFLERAAALLPTSATSTAFQNADPFAAFAGLDLTVHAAPADPAPSDAAPLDEEEQLLRRMQDEHRGQVRRK
jgi:hypothetical protein